MIFVVQVVLALIQQATLMMLREVEKLILMNELMNVLQSYI